MSRASLPAPGLLWGPCPERAPGAMHAARQGGAALWLQLRAWAQDLPPWRRARDARWLRGLHEQWSALRAGTDVIAPQAPCVQRVRATLLREGLTEASSALALALAAEAAHRALGLRPFDVQLLAARAVLEGHLAEMATGEGKTLAVALAAAAAALAGLPVHVITANDYLVERDALKAQPLYESLGLNVACVRQPDAPATRALAYAADITCVTARELVFDYLRDAQCAAAPGTGVPVLRGLCMAIVDEADAILLDEARVPFVLAQAVPMDEAVQHARQALHFARGLQTPRHYQLDTAVRQARLTAAGRDRLARATAAADRGERGALPPAWRHRVHREHAVCMALAALHLHERGRHYLVRDGAVQLVDDNTGRVADGRAWSQGLHQLVELKEGLPPSPGQVTLAQLTYQRFFPRYHRLGGLSGTLTDARRELAACYGLCVRRVPLRQPCRRRQAPTRLWPDRATLMAAVVQRVQALQGAGRPVLVAVDSVAQADALAALLGQAGLAPAVLHARSDALEAAIVARSGELGAVTVATNVAGRGTDITLGPGVAERGGLHVLSCQLNVARRIDRQLAGRAARQGDPGSCETWLSLDHPLLQRHLGPWGLAVLRHLAPARSGWLAQQLLRWAQRREEARQRLERERLIRHDEQMERRLSFAGHDL